jgi:hypothetical protein
VTATEAASLSKNVLVQFSKKRAWRVVEVSSPARRVLETHLRAGAQPIKKAPTLSVEARSSYGYSLN